MPHVIPFLTYESQAEAAVNHYLEVFGKENLVITSTMPGPNGQVFAVNFELFGRPIYTLNGGPSFAFTQGFSLFVSCDTQLEIDDYWAKLTREGKEVQCGWLVDKFGVSWQIVPSVLGSLLGGPDPEKAGRAMQAMLKMVKLDIAALKRAYDGK